MDFYVEEAANDNLRLDEKFQEYILENQENEDIYEETYYY